MTEFTFYTQNNASTEARPLLEQIKSSFGFIPNLFAYMAEAPTTIEAYLALIALLKKTSLSESEAQLALLTTSIENECDFCQTAHLAFAKKFGVNEQTLQALLHKNKIESQRDAILVGFTQCIVRKRGQLSENDINTFLAAGYTKQQIMEVILTVALKTLSNYINHITHPEVNSEILSLL